MPDGDPGRMSQMSQPVPFRALRDLLRQSAAALLDAGVPFALMGTFGVWARGGPRPPLVEDVDYAVRMQDIPAATEALAAAGFEILHPYQGWLAKALHPTTNAAGERLMVDLIHSPAGLPISDEVLARASTVYLEAMALPCLAPIDMMTTKLHMVVPSHLDYTGIIERARVLREQFDWDELEQRATGSDAALGFFDLARRFGIDPRVEPPRTPLRNESATSMRRFVPGGGVPAG